MKYTVFNLDTAIEMKCFSTEKEAIEYCTTNGLEPVRIKQGGQVSFPRPPFTDNTDRMLYVLPKYYPLGQ